MKANQVFLSVLVVICMGSIAFAQDPIWPVSNQSYPWNGTYIIYPEQALYFPPDRLNVYIDDKKYELMTPISINELGLGRHLLSVLILDSFKESYQFCERLIFNVDMSMEQMNEYISNLSFADTIPSKIMKNIITRFIQQAISERDASDLNRARNIIRLFSKFITNPAFMLLTGINLNSIHFMNQWGEYESAYLMPSYPEEGAVRRFNTSGCPVLSINPNSPALQSQIVGEFSKTFNSIPGGIGFSMADFNVFTSPLELMGIHINTIKITPIPNTPSNGSIYISDGRIIELLNARFMIEVPDATYGPFDITIPLEGVQSWADYTSCVYRLSGLVNFPPGLPILGGITAFFYMDKTVEGFIGIIPDPTTGPPDFMSNATFRVTEDGKKDNKTITGVSAVMIYQIGSYKQQVPATVTITSATPPPTDPLNATLVRVQATATVGVEASEVAVVYTITDSNKKTYTFTKVWKK